MLNTRAIHVGTFTTRPSVPKAGQLRIRRFGRNTAQVIRLLKGRPSAEPPLLPDGLYVVANKRVVRGHDVQTLAPGDFPRYVRWDPPTEPADSGWVLFVGDETQADADDPDTFQINALGTVLAVHPQLRQILRAGVSGQWEWQDAAQRYELLPPE